MNSKGMYRIRNPRTFIFALVGAVGLGSFVGVSAMAAANQGSARLEIGFVAGTSRPTIWAIEHRYSLTEVPMHQAPAARLVTVPRAAETLVLAELRVNPHVVTAAPISDPLH